MRKAHFEKYLSADYDLDIIEESNVEVLEGVLIPKQSGRDKVNIMRGVARFAMGENYSENFGLQWNKFKSTQLDSASGLSLTADRFWTNTRWLPEGLANKLVLEVGSGAGRFTEVLLEAGAKVVSFDYSTAVDANYASNSKKGDLFLFQGDLYDIPFPDGYFDYVFCFGVLQHTPNPKKAYEAIFSRLAPGGQISIDYYRKRRVPTPWSTPKYLWRPVTTKLKPRSLLRVIEFYIHYYLPIDTIIRKIPIIGCPIVAVLPIPCWNYTDIGLSKEQRLAWAIMDTFDALGAAFDQPKTLEEVKVMVDSPQNRALEIFKGSNGIVANMTKR